jgi:integrase
VPHLDHASGLYDDTNRDRQDDMKNSSNRNEYKGHTILTQATTVKGREYERFVVDFRKDHRGNRQRKTYSSADKAKAGIREHKDKTTSQDKARSILEKRIGEKAQKLSTDDLLDAVKGAEVLNGLVSLERAARFYIEHNHPDGEHKTIKELCTAYRDSRIKADRAPATIKDIERNLDPFASEFDTTDCRHITTAQIESWHDAQNGNARRRNKRRRHLVGMFNFAVKRKFRNDNPASAIEIVTERNIKPFVLPVADIDAVMHYTEEHYPEMVPYLALCMFAGIRPDGEMSRLDWKDIDLARREVFISDVVSKTNDERYIEMSDNLFAWIAPHAQESGKILFSKRKFDEIREKAEVKRWEQDCMRHSFGSYHLAMHENSGKTIEQMGHRQMNTFFKHYRRAVRQDEAQGFWNIQPGAETKILQLHKTA